MQYFTNRFKYSSCNRSTDSPEPQTYSSKHEAMLNRTDSGKNNTDISEGSTNTDEYITCTDNSKCGTGAQGIKISGATSSSSTQVPGSNPCSFIYGIDVFSFLCC